jgi:DUF218 domain
MYFVRDINGTEPIQPISVTEGPWESFFKISDVIHSDKVEDFAGRLAENASRVATADLAAATIAAVYRAGKLPLTDVEEMLELCANSLTNHQFQSLPFGHFRRRLFDVEHVVTPILGCQNLMALRRRANAAVALCADTGKAMRLVPSGLRPPRGKIRTNQEFVKLQEYLEEEIRRRRTDIVQETTIFPITVDPTSTNTNQNIQNILTASALVPAQGKSALVIVSSTFHLMQIAKIINDHIEKGRFDIKERFSFVGLVGAERRDNVTTFTTYDHQYVKQLAFQLYLDHIQ